jgi:hypothetical protein
MAMRFVQPNRILYLATETVPGETAQSGGHVFGRKEQIQVFGGAPDSGMDLKGESARDHIRHATAIQDHQCFPEEGFLFRRKLWLP